ncbi:MAG: SUMF1/EgtB/PvdO family nonheme iron enzyme [Akkermansia sp.]|nr:SUMF1/EgtB/PvdO family nonheme iron enzyme [Akkermansia sp.]
MIPIFPELPLQLGEYSLTRLLELRANTALYEAQQNHVDRAVVLEVLSPAASHEEEASFLAQSRLRVASSELPHVAHVYESLQVGGFWLLTQEMPKGRSLADIASAGSCLSVPQLCRIIQAAAEMYDLCSMAGLSAMPLASSSIYMEPQGTPHFLSPLTEDITCEPRQQMQALAAALWKLLPQQQEPGRGRISTLVQWLHEGYEGAWLSWHTVGETAGTILHQLAESERQAVESTTHYKLTHHPLLLQTRNFLRHWGTYLGICGTLIIALSCLGSLFGLAEPEHLPAANETALLCHQDGVNYRLMAHPVTVAEYAQFLQEAAPRTEALPAELEGGLEPADWETQQQHPDVPVCGVSYWQAQFYATTRGGTIPSAQQLQLLLQQKLPFPSPQEWSSTELQNPLPGVYSTAVYLLIDAEGHPRPVSDRKWSAPTTGFRLTFPEHQKDKDL